MVMEALLSPARVSRVDGLWVEGPDPSILLNVLLVKSLFFNTRLPEFSGKITG